MIDAFIVKGMDYSSTGLYFKTGEQLMRAIEQELVNQVSVEFYNARELCNLCNLPIRRYSYWDWEPGTGGAMHAQDGEKVRKQKRQNGDGYLHRSTTPISRTSRSLSLGLTDTLPLKLKDLGSFLCVMRLLARCAISSHRPLRGIPFWARCEVYGGTTDDRPRMINQLREKLELPDLPRDDPEKAVAAVQAEVSKLREGRCRALTSSMF